MKPTAQALDTPIDRCDLVSRDRLKFGRLPCWLLLLSEMVCHNSEISKIRNVAVLAEELILSFNLRAIDVNAGNVRTRIGNFVIPWRAFLVTPAQRCSSFGIYSTVLRALLARLS